MTRREFRKSLGSRKARREGVKSKRQSSGKMSEPMRVRYAVRVKQWLRGQA